MSKFKITNGKGFHITFDNDFTVSVQFGPGNFCDYRDGDWKDGPKLASKGCSNAECAVWRGKGMNLIAMPEWDGEAVGGWMTSHDVLELLNWAASQPKGE